MEPNSADSIEQLADEISFLLRAQDSPYAPSVRSLASRLGKRHEAICAARHLLVARGELITLGPRRLIIKGRPTVDTTVQVRSVCALAQRLRGSILSGDTAVGDQLPKLAYMARENHMSTASVRAAIHELMREGLVHQVGRRFVIGRQPRHISTGPTAPPVVLVVAREPLAWFGVCSSRRVQKFGLTFLGETERFGVQLIELATGLEAASAGLDRVLNIAKSLEGRLLGSIFVNSRLENPELHGSITAMLRLERPVVWFDRLNEGLERPISDRRFTRCHFDEGTAVKAATDHLVAFGHRRAAYCHFQGEAWQLHRLKLLKRAADRTGRLSIVGHVLLSTSDWMQVDTSELVARLEAVEWLGKQEPWLAEIMHCVPAYLQSTGLAVQGGGRTSLERLADHLRTFNTFQRTTSPSEAELAYKLRAIVSLAPLLVDNNVSCVLSPNDKTANVHIVPWMRSLGIVPPHRYSILSFDNELLDSVTHLTSVDFGFGYLGNRAFHAIFGGVPVLRNRKGEIAAIPRVIDRGSVVQKES